MKRLLLALGLLLGLAAPAAAQVPCGAVNSVPQVGVTCLQEPFTASYAATAVGFVPAASATDVSCINGAAGKVIRIQMIRVSGSAGTLVNVPVPIRKNASLDTPGNFATGTAAPTPYALDSNFAIAVASTSAFTSNPTINDTAPGITDSGILPLSLTGTTGITAPYLLFDYTERNFMAAPILRSAAQLVCVNFTTTSVSSGVVNITWRWTEAQN